MRRIQWLLFVSLVVGGTSCAGGDKVGLSQDHQGSIRLPLATLGETGSEYRLDAAAFVITGTTDFGQDYQAELSANPSDLVLRHQLPAGGYEIELQDGWVLRRDNVRLEPYQVELDSPNPEPFSVSAYEATEVAFRFLVDSAFVDFGGGSLNVTIEVDEAICGNGECENDEEYWCVEDCGYCGDGICVGSETEWCIEDCDEPQPVTPGDTCDDPYVLDMTGASVSGSTTDANHDTTGYCGGSGADRVYAFEVSDRVMANFETIGYDTVIYVRDTCADAELELACDDQGGVNDGSRLSVVLDPGEYFIWVDSWYGPGDYTLHYSFNPDPCADEELACPGTPLCQSASDWSDFECVCPEGTLSWEGDCVDDPCEPQPCTDNEFQSVCVADLPDAFSCDCDAGYMLDAGVCVPDPDASEWLFMVFLNGDNNLSPAALDDLNEMSEAGSNADVQIVALVDTYEDPGRYVVITQEGFDVIEELGEVDMNDWRVLRDFGAWAVDNFPARHQMLVLWDHGSGWRGMRESIPRGAPFKGFSNDDHSQSEAYEISISNGDYARALSGITNAAGRKLDVVGFDACLMGMWEIAEASAPFADYLLASSELEPFDGWNYDLFLPEFVANPHMTAQELGAAVIDTYFGYSPANSTLSLTDLSTLDALTAAVDAFALALLDHPDFSQLQALREQAQSFVGEYADLRHFADLVAQESADLPLVLDPAVALSQQIGLSVVYHQSQTEYGYEHAYGLSIHFPMAAWGYLEDTYTSGEGAVWSQRTHWDEFLAASFLP